MQPLNVEIPIVRAWAQVKKTREVVRWIFLSGNVSKFNVERRGRKSCLQLLDGAVDVEGARGEAAVHGVSIAAELSVPSKILVRAPSG